MQAVELEVDVGCDIHVDDAASFHPWKLRPYCMVSWWEMLQFSGRRFFYSSIALRGIMFECVLSCLEELDGAPKFLYASPIGPQLLQKSCAALAIARDEFRRMGLGITASTVQELLDGIEQGKAHNVRWLVDQVKAVEGLVKKETKGNWFFYVSKERGQYFPTEAVPWLFGEAVSQSFPEAAFDISESGTCLALARPTACVFHLMRVLEIGLAAIGHQFKISLSHANWKTAIDQIESAVRKMDSDPEWRDRSDRKEQQEAFAQAIGHFGVIKDPGATIRCTFAANTPKRKRI